jgi:hypothetical protein
MRKRSQDERRKKPGLPLPEASAFESGRDPDDETADNFYWITANLVIEFFWSDGKELSKAVIDINDSTGRNVIDKRLVGSPFFAKLPYGDYSVKLSWGNRSINRTVTIFPRAQLRLSTSWSHETTVTGSASRAKTDFLKSFYIIPAGTKTDSLPAARGEQSK